MCESTPNGPQEYEYNAAGRLLAVTGIPSGSVAVSPVAAVIGQHACTAVGFGDRGSLQGRLGHKVSIDRTAASRTWRLLPSISYHQ